MAEYDTSVTGHVMECGVEGQIRVMGADAQGFACFVITCDAANIKAGAGQILRNEKGVTLNNPILLRLASDELKFELGFRLGAVTPGASTCAGTGTSISPKSMLPRCKYRERRRGS